MSDRSRLRDAIRIGGVGALYAVGYSLLDISFGEISVPWPETWRVGVAQPYVAAGLSLVVFAWLWHRGHGWAEVPILCWASMTILAGGAWADRQGVAVFDTIFVAVALALGLMWAGGAYLGVFRHHRRRDG